MEDFERLKKVRITFDFTQKKFANSMGFRQSYYSEVESGEKSITYKLLKKLADSHGISPLYIILGVGPIRINDLPVSVLSKGQKSPNLYAPSSKSEYVTMDQLEKMLEERIKNK